MDNHLTNGEAPVAPPSRIDPSKISIPGNVKTGKGVEPANVVPFPHGGREKGGEGGGEAAPATLPVSASLPPLPPSAGRGTETALEARGSAIGEDVYRPAPSENPALVALKQLGLYRGQRESGDHGVTCPWAAEHHDPSDVAATYKEPDRSNPVGRFCCERQHQETPDIVGLLNHLGIDPDDARCKPQIRLVRGGLDRIAAAAELVIAQSCGCYQSGGIIVLIKVDPISGDISTEAVNEQSLTKMLSGAADWLSYDGRTKGWVRCDPPTRIVQMLLKGQSYEHLPVLKGLARQPFFRKADGELATEPGYDPVSKMYAVFDPAEFSLPEPTEKAAREALAELKYLIREFHFASESDESAALSAMITAAVRPSLPVAPAVSATAPHSGSGKSLLAQLAAAFGGPGAPLNLSYPPDSAEATKAVLAMLMSRPAVVIYDDMQTDWQPYGVMNRMLTSETITDRILGSSRTVTVSTATFIMGTGNGIGPVGDMCRRVITINLNPGTSSPATLRYSGRPVEEITRNRAHYVGCALTIVRAWQRAGCPRTDVLDIATYGGAWADFCRHPLIWLGEPDPATSLIEQIHSNADSAPLGNLMREWRGCFGQRAVTLRKVVDQAEGDRDGLLYEALMELPIVERGFINRSKFGQFLRKNAHRIVDGLEIRKAHNSERNAWVVVSVDGNENSVETLPSIPRGPVIDPHDVF